MTNEETCRGAHHSYLFLCLCWVYDLPHLIPDAELCQGELNCCGHPEEWREGDLDVQEELSLA